MQEKLKGIFPALLTPFDASGAINKEQLKKLIRCNVDKGVRGFYVCGSTGEAFLLSADERKAVMEIVRETAPESTLIAHIGSLNEREAIDLACHAKKLGYDLISSVTPFYYKFSFGEIRDYYCRLADAGELPMLVYYIPALSGVSMDSGEITSFLADPRFAGIKFTSNDFFTMALCKSAFPDKVLYNGYDEMLLSGLAAGADGGIGSTYNFMAEKFIQIQKLFLDNKPDEARAVQNEANRIIAILCKVGVMQAEKEILNQMGFDFGCCRHPFGELDDEAKALLRREVTEKL